MSFTNKLPLKSALTQNRPLVPSFPFLIVVHLHIHQYLGAEFVRCNAFLLVRTERLGGVVAHKVNIKVKVRDPDQPIELDVLPKPGPLHAPRMAIR